MAVLALDQEDPDRLAGPPRPKEPTPRSPGNTVVAILDGSPMVARVLELLLRGAGYGTRLLEEAEADRPDGLPLGGVDLLLLAPGPSSEQRGALLGAVRSAPETAHLPVLILLSTTSEGAPTKEAGIVAWPCRTEELVREIEAALAHVAPRP